MPLPANLIRQFEKNPSVGAIQDPGLNLPIKLYLLEQYIQPLWKQIGDQFKIVFPFIEDMKVTKATSESAWWMDLPVAGDFPMLWLKERNSDQYVPLTEMSSGMQKVLLLITDVITSDPSLLYIIDEYENSLGFNAIDFLPGFLLECGEDRQFIVTSHHPHLINAIPVTDWFVFHRQGTRISVKSGAELEERYGRSKQQRFIQLLNDPFFSEGVE
jgi:predicted ATPase